MNKTAETTVSLNQQTASTYAEWAHQRVLAHERLSRATSADKKTTRCWPLRNCES